MHIIIQNALVPKVYCQRRPKKVKIKIYKEIPRRFHAEVLKDTKHGGQSISRISSDPYIIDLRKIPQKQSKPLPQDVINL